VQLYAYLLLLSPTLTPPSLRSGLVYSPRQKLLLYTHCLNQPYSRTLVSTSLDFFPFSCIKSHIVHSGEVLMRSTLPQHTASTTTDCPSTARYRKCELRHVLGSETHGEARNSSAVKRCYPYHHAVRRLCAHLPLLHRKASSPPCGSKTRTRCCVYATSALVQPLQLPRPYVAVRPHHCVARQ